MTLLEAVPQATSTTVELPALLLSGMVWVPALAAIGLLFFPTRTDAHRERMRSFAIGATHMALGWVLTEGITVDPDSGEVHDLTIRSFGIVRAKDMPPVEITIVPDAREPLAGSSDAVFAAVAAATWNALTRAEGARPDTFPARRTRAARRLRR